MQRVPRKKSTKNNSPPSSYCYYSTAEAATQKSVEKTNCSRDVGSDCPTRQRNRISNRKKSLSADNATRNLARLSNQPAATAETATAQNKCRLYTCPFCSGRITSAILTGQVNHRSVCGNQFRVRNGQVTARRYHHTCPTCNATIYSAHESGRIQCKHATPSGELCSRKEWQVHLARTATDTPPSKRRKRTN